MPSEAGWAQFSAKMTIQLLSLEAEPLANDDLKTEKSLRVVGLDPMQIPLESPSSWPMEFERQQREIIEHWHACYVSLVHRTYFFLLFKGDPADSIYMEVELRRLSFLRNLFSQGNLAKTLMENGRAVTAASSIKTLRKEREMLSKKMRKSFSTVQRDDLYRRWGIGLNTKRRRLQLINLLWSETGNMDHIARSASIIAKVIGFVQPGQATKEMFGLSFTPQRTGHKSYMCTSVPLTL
ncbi:hypothetical protein ACLOJK_033885 [Asimina triloba]